MPYYKGSPGYAIFLGIVISIIAGVSQAPYLIAVGLLLIGLGVVGILVAYQPKGSEKKVKITSDHKEQLEDVNTYCPECLMARKIGLRKCPECGKKL
jgi:xanthosine utilization system XapX-like protein